MNTKGEGMISQSRLTTYFLAGRKAEHSTEMFLQVCDLDEPVIFLELWTSDKKHIGYARLERRLNADEIRMGRSVAMFELSELLSADSPVPHPIVALSGVLWNRRELAAELGLSLASPAQEDLPEEFGTQPSAARCPHEA